MNAEEYKNGSFEYKGWHVVREIDSGSFGTVYEIEREDFGYLYKAALKVISIPRSEQDLNAVKKNIGKSDGSLEIYYESIASEIVKEFELMYQLRGNSNIVSYEDHEIRKHKDGIGWDIFIRMELLTPLDVYIREHPMGRKDVIRLGIDVCKALERCRMLDIIHRDIKPGNIFVSPQGDYKLGDFGIARTLEAHDDVLELSRKGTVNYMAPEVFRGLSYSFDVDIYSLGIVMYRLLNNNTLPFMPQPPNKSTHRDISMSNQLRFGGKPLPRPVKDNTQLADVVLKACCYRPEGRYQNPKVMREHLEMVQRGEVIDEFDDGTVLLSTQESLDKPRGTIIKGVVIALVLVIILIVIFIFFAGWWKAPEKNDVSSQETIEIQSIQTNGQNNETTQDLQSVIDQKDFVSAYKMIQDGTKNGENLDIEIASFVQACEIESEYKRAVAVMKLLTDNVTDNETFYRETVKWFYDHDKADYARQIIMDLRNKGENGEKLADSISLEYDKNNEN